MLICISRETRILKSPSASSSLGFLPYIKRRNRKLGAGPFSSASGLPGMRLALIISCGWSTPLARFIVLILFSSTKMHRWSCRAAVNWPNGGYSYKIYGMCTATRSASAQGGGCHGSLSHSLVETKVRSAFALILRLKAPGAGNYYVRATSRVTSKAANRGHSGSGQWISSKRRPIFGFLSSPKPEFLRFLVTSRR